LRVGGERQVPWPLGACGRHASADEFVDRFADADALLAADAVHLSRHIVGEVTVVRMTDTLAS